MTATCIETNVGVSPDFGIADTLEYIAQKLRDGYLDAKMSAIDTDGTEITIPPSPGTRSILMIAYTATTNPANPNPEEIASCGALNNALQQAQPIIEAG